jgi:capsular polysaccharide biosynthesis protein
MEIRDYLRAIRRILWLVIAIPIVAGLLVGGFIELQPSSYQADAFVVVPAITANGISQSAASQYTSTFKDVLTSQQVIPSVSQKFNISQPDLLAGLSSSTTTASSNLINVVLVGKKGQDLVGAVREATVETMNAIAAPQLVQANIEVTNAATLLAKAQAAINNFDLTYNNPSPVVQFNGQHARVFQEEAELQTLVINNDIAKEPILKATIAKDTALLTQDGDQLQIFEPLSAALNAANAANAHAATAQVAANALIATDSTPGTVTTKDVGRLSKLSDTIKFAAIAFALALLMMLGLILILELMRGGKRPQQAAADAGQQGAFAWPPPSAQTRAAGPPATPAMAGTAPATRDPWRATDSSAVVADGNGNGNGHDSGGVPANVPGADADPQRAGLSPRR